MQKTNFHNRDAFSRKILLIFLLIFPVFLCHAQPTWYKSNCPRSQKQAEIWYFGEKAGVDFRSGTAVPLNDQNSMMADMASAVISDSLGNLLFYTNGKIVWDRNDSLMPNATRLAGSKGATQPLCYCSVAGQS